MDPHNPDISSMHRLFFASNSAMSEFDPCEEDVNSERNSGAKILNLIAPSSSRGTV